MWGRPPSAVQTSEARRFFFTAGKLRHYPAFGLVCPQARMPQRHSGVVPYNSRNLSAVRTRTAGVCPVRRFPTGNSPGTV